MPTRSSALFSTGVPVRAQLRRRGDRADHLAGVLCAVLDPLRFVEHDQVEMDARTAPRVLHASRSRQRTS